MAEGEDTVALRRQRQRSVSKPCEALNDAEIMLKKTILDIKHARDKLLAAEETRCDVLNSIGRDPNDLLASLEKFEDTFNQFKETFTRHLLDYHTATPVQRGVESGYGSGVPSGVISASGGPQFVQNRAFPDLHIHETDEPPGALRGICTVTVPTQEVGDRSGDSEA